MLSFVNKLLWDDILVVRAKTLRLELEHFKKKNNQWEGS